MKKYIYVLLIISSFLLTPVEAQTVYKVVPGTKENELILSISNESVSSDAAMIKIALVNNPKGIEICNRSVRIENLKRGEEKKALFTFEAHRVPEMVKDTLRFIITDEKGESWNKEIILEYSLPSEFKLEQNYPNPFNPATTIEYSIPVNGKYNLSVYNILGQLIETLSEREYQPGYYKVNFNASGLPSGTYLFRLSGNKINIVKKMMLVK